MSVRCRPLLESRLSVSRAPAVLGSPAFSSPGAPSVPWAAGAPASRCGDFADPLPWRGEQEQGMSSAHHSTTELDLNSPEPPGPFHFVSL